MSSRDVTSIVIFTNKVLQENIIYINIRFPLNVLKNIHNKFQIINCSFFYNGNLSLVGDNIFFNFSKMLFYLKNKKSYLLITWKCEEIENIINLFEKLV